MPLEIRELIIRTQIISDEGRQAAGGGKPHLLPDTKELVDQCVEKVLKALRKQTER